VNERLAFQERWDVVVVSTIALLARSAVTIWAAARIPPTADGQFYHVIAGRIAKGLGYTWLWPDGVVTIAAHYPVGYPAILGAFYAVFGAHPWVAMMANALLGTVMAALVHAIAREGMNRPWALLAGIIVALHPAFVPYTAALMSDGAASTFCVAAVALTMATRRAKGKRQMPSAMALGIVLGLGALVRPQMLLCVPFLGWLASAFERNIRKRWLVVLAVGSLSLVTVMPWVVRNQVRMGHAGLSFNGGWNLLIGTDASAHGTYAPLQVPPSCRDVFDEAKKDHCFAKAARERIASDPRAWSSLIPQKLASTFDYCGAAVWYLHDANPTAFPYRAKLIGAGIETAAIRLLWIASVLAVARIKGPRPSMRAAGAVVSVIFFLTPHGWAGVVGLLFMMGLLGKKLATLPIAVPATAIVIGTTMLTHAAFFGAGRYAMMTLALIPSLIKSPTPRNEYDSPSDPWAKASMA